MKYNFLATVLMLVSTLSFASEADNFSKRYIPMKDASKVLNDYTTVKLRAAVLEANYSGSCDYKRLYKKVVKQLKGNLWNGQVESFAIENRAKTLDRYLTPLKGSIYDTLSFWQSPVPHLFAAGMGAIMKLKVGDDFHVVGADKLGHFFTEGHGYFSKVYLKNKGIESALK